MPKNSVRHTFPRHTEFCALVDIAIASLENSPVSKNLLIYPAAYEAIRAAIFDESKTPQAPLSSDISDDLRDVMSELTYSNVLNETTLNPYYQIACTLRDALNKPGRTESIRTNSPRWIEAIRIVYSYMGVREHTLSDTPQARQVTHASAVLYFNKRRISLVMKGQNLELPSVEDKLAISATVMEPLKMLGDSLGMQVMNNLLRQRFDSKVGRLRFHANPDMMGNKVDRQLPCGLLYRFALKNLGHKARPFKAEKIAKSVLEAATHFAALHDVEPFSVYETMFPPRPEKVMTVLNGISTFDELFSVPQCDPRVVQRLLENLRAKVPSQEASIALGWSMADVLGLWTVLLEFSPSLVESRFVSRNAFIGRLIQCVGAGSARNRERSFVLKSANSSYSFPSDAARSDTRDCCLVEASGDRYWIPGQLLLAPAFFSRLVRTRASHDLGFNDKMGKAFERYLVERMQNLGISCRHGNIVGSNKSMRSGDIDLLIETEDTIGLFELKKKTLNRASNAGNGAQLFVDLGRGLVHGVNQISKHEITLMRDKELRFEEGPPIVLNGRRILKGVISLADFGGLHDASIVRNTLRTLCGARVLEGDVPPGMEEAFQEANAHYLTLSERYREFSEIESKIDIFENFSFRNVFFVEYLVSRASSAKELLKALSTSTRMMTGCRDPFFEHAQLHP